MTRIICCGLGDIGLATARIGLNHPDLEVVAAIDLAPGKADRSLGELAGVDSDIVVSGDAAATLAETRPDVVLLSTTSKLPTIADQIIDCLEAGAAVVNTCEELAFPWGREGAERIDMAAKKAGLAVLGTGVNPGFVMDLLPATLALPCAHVDSVTIKRSVDLSRRREALQKKAGVGMTKAEFDELASRDAIGHVGLDSSIRLVAAALGLDVDWAPVALTPLADDEGTVYGFRQWTEYPANNGAPGIKLILTMSARLDEEEEDSVTIEGDPPIQAVIEGGIFGDTATAALAINAIPQVLDATPGLKTVLDIPPARGWKPKA